MRYGDDGGKCFAADGFLEFIMEDLALLVAIIILSQLLVALLSIILSFTKFKILTAIFAILSIMSGAFFMFTTLQIVIPGISILAGILSIINLLRKK